MNRYRLLEPIGQGGMGRVWRAADELLDRPVAVKELRLDVIESEDTGVRRERALREARASARIDHPNVVRVYDVAEQGDRLWIVMELVEAPSLDRTVRDRGPLGGHETARVGLALVEALRRVHLAGVLHRDIKPGNVLLEPGGRVVLTDFGIAAVQDSTALTRTGLIVGSPEYMPPERIAGRAQGPPSDLWSLGATLCTALTGHSPFERGSTLATLHAAMYEDPELPPADHALTPLLRRLLERDPAARPDATEVARVLTGVLGPALPFPYQLQALAQTPFPAPPADRSAAPGPYPSVTPEPGRNGGRRTAQGDRRSALWGRGRRSAPPVAADGGARTAPGGGRAPAPAPRLDGVPAPARRRTGPTRPPRAARRPGADRTVRRPRPDGPGRGSGAPGRQAPEWLPRLLTVLVLVVAAAVAAVMIVTAVRPGGETRLPEQSTPPTVAGTSRPPASPDATTPPR
ncbi:serine/threonine-protein kinase [Streptomyces minutiscleroticus]|nr:serine/threonine-protein kinase [Streptomyces minutiscleroticus]